MASHLASLWNTAEAWGNSKLAYYFNMQIENWYNRIVSRYAMV